MHCGLQFTSRSGSDLAEPVISIQTGIQNAETGGQICAFY